MKNFMKLHEREKKYAGLYNHLDDIDKEFKKNKFRYILH